MKLMTILVLCLLVGTAQDVNAQARKRLSMAPNSSDKEQQYQSNSRRNTQLILLSENEASDPFLVYNKPMHGFNMFMSKWVFVPVANVYTGTVPKPVQSKLGNGFRNLRQPLTSVNFLLMGEPGYAVESAFRFLVNSTVGVFGLFDIAESVFGVEYREANFGNTMAFYGVPEGPYLVLPFLGPSTLRESLAISPDYYIDPLTYELQPDTQQTLYLLDKSNVFAQNKDALVIITENEANHYAFMRELYLERLKKENLIMKKELEARD